MSNLAHENDDLLDAGLSAVMGPGRCIDATKNVSPKKNKPQLAAVKPAEAKNIPADIEFAPPVSAPSYMDRLRNCAKHSVIYGGLCVLFFLWQQKGLMDAAAAVPAMLTCSAMWGLNVGKTALK